MARKSTKGPPGDREERFYWNNPSKRLTIPGAGVFEVNVEGEYVERVLTENRATPKNTEPDPVLDAISEYFTGPDSTAQLYLNRNPGTNTKLLLCKGFGNLGQLRASVPNIAELSTRITSLGEDKPRFVLAVEMKDNKTTAMRVRGIENRLRDQQVDAHILRVPGLSGEDIG